jgi:PilZ domain
MPSDRSPVPSPLAHDANADALSADRRSRARYPIGLPVRVHVDGMERSLLAELADVSATGCFLRGADIADVTDLGDRLAFGFVTQTLGVGLVRGRVVRRSPGGEGLGVVIEQANSFFDELLGTLAQNGRTQV